MALLAENGSLFCFRSCQYISRDKNSERAFPYVKMADLFISEVKFVVNDQIIPEKIKRMLLFGCKLSYSFCND